MAEWAPRARECFRHQDVIRERFEHFVPDIPCPVCLGSLPNAPLTSPELSQVRDGLYAHEFYEPSEADKFLLGPELTRKRRGYVKPYPWMR